MERVEASPAGDLRARVVKVRKDVAGLFLMIVGGFALWKGAFVYWREQHRSDPLKGPRIELEDRLAHYVRTDDPTPVYEWASAYHGEAPGHDLMIGFVRWGNSHPRRMERLLSTWPEESIDDVRYRLRWAGTDSLQHVRFDLGDEP